MKPVPGHNCLNSVSSVVLPTSAARRESSRLKMRTLGVQVAANQPSGKAMALGAASSKVKAAKPCLPLSAVLASAYQMRRAVS